MKYFILALLVIPTFAVLSAQNTVDDFDYIDQQYDSTVYNSKSSIKPLKKVKFGADVNMGYSFSSNGYGGPMFLLSPYASYPLGKRFSISAGISAGYGNFYNPYMAENGGNSMLPMTQMFIYVSGNYQVSERLIVSGSVYKQILDVPNRNPGQTSSNFDSQGVAVGFQYMITPNISFGAQIRVEEPGYFSPYNSSGYGTGSMYGPNWW